MTRTQHEMTRERRRVEGEWLKAYGWKQQAPDQGNRWSHPNAPKLKPHYAQKDALALTDAEPLRYGSVR